MSLVMDRRGELTDHEIEALAKRIRAVETRHDALSLVEVGRLILDELFDGDLEALRSHHPHKATSLRRLATQLNRTTSRLSTAASVAVQYERLPAGLRDRLTGSHYEALLRAPEIEREAFARQAVMADLSVRQLRALIAGEDILPDPEPADRSPIAVMERAVEPLRQRVLDAVERDPEQAGAYLERVDALIEELRAVRRALRRKI